MIEHLRTALAGRYEVEREIGAGGMATVYLARDLRHDRRVALKLLKPDLGALLGSERFLSEIRVTANLQHPNLLPLFDSGEADGHLFYVMPYVDGESLRAKLDREKQLPIDEAIHIAIAIGNALEYAHAHGVIHRDLKPENILLQSGQPMIADFGIALAVSQAGGNRITQTGLSLGTPQYMSPEQATGDRVIDKRSDIYSLGAMTYEMLTGEPPHTGHTSQAVIARLLTERPRPIRASRSAVPEHVDDAVARALEKLPADRFSSAREFCDAVQGRSTAATSMSSASKTRSARSWKDRRRDPVVAALAVTAAIAMLAAVFFARRTVDTDRPTIRFVYGGTDSTRPTFNWPWPAAISPDGSTLIYSVSTPTGQALHALRTDQVHARRIPGTDFAYSAIFSPDGQWIAYQQSQKTFKVRLDGSTPIKLGDAGGANGLAWSSRGELFVGAEAATPGLSRFSANGSELVPITTPDSSKGETSHLWPALSPNGKRVYFVIWSGSQTTATLATVAADGGDIVRFGIKGLRTIGVIDDVLLYVDHTGLIMGARLTRSGKGIKGAPVAVHDAVPVIPDINGNSDVYLSTGGALVTSQGTPRSRLAWVNPDGTMRILGTEARRFGAVSLSPDGSRVAVAIEDNARMNDVWIFDVATGTMTRLTTAASAQAPRWSHDGREIFFIGRSDKARFAIWRKAAEGGAPATKVVDISSLSIDINPTPDGKTILYSVYDNTSWDIYRIDLAPGSRPRPFINSAAQERVERVSPNGKWILSSSDETGQLEVYARSFADPGSRVQISSGGGEGSAWSPDGGRVYYRVGASMLVATLSLTPNLRVVRRDTLFARAAQNQELVPMGFDLASDGKRFLGLVVEKGDFKLVVVPDWKRELKQRMAAGGR